MDHDPNAMLETFSKVVERLRGACDACIACKNVQEQIERTNNTFIELQKAYEAENKILEDELQAVKFMQTKKSLADRKVGNAARYQVKKVMFGTDFSCVDEGQP